MKFDKSKVITDGKDTVQGRMYYVADALNYLRQSVQAEDMRDVNECAGGMYAGVPGSPIKISWKYFYPVEEKDMRKFDASKIISAVNADKAVVGERYYTGISLSLLKKHVEQATAIYSLEKILEESFEPRFQLQDRDRLNRVAYLYPVVDEALRPFQTAEEFLKKGSPFSFYYCVEHKCFVKITAVKDTPEGLFFILSDRDTAVSAVYLARLSLTGIFLPSVKGVTSARYFGINTATGEGMPLIKSGKKED